MRSGKSLLIGAVARIDQVQGQPFSYTCVFAHKVTLHITDTTKVSDLINKRATTLLIPPLDKDRTKELTMGVLVKIPLHGRGWRQSCVDVVFPGLGWVSLTGCGDVTLMVAPPIGTDVFIREPLLPYEAPTTGRKWRRPSR